MRWRAAINRRKKRICHSYPGKCVYKGLNQLQAMFGTAITHAGSLGWGIDE